MKRAVIGGVISGILRYAIPVILSGLFLYLGVKPEELVAQVIDDAPRWLTPTVRAIALIFAGGFGFWAFTVIRNRRAAEDHWAERKQVEISALANVSAGREPTDFPIANDPENARFRQLKDAVNTGELKAADLHGDRANVMTAITIDEFRKFANRAGKDYWKAVLARWGAKQPAANGNRPRSILADPEPGITMAAWWAVMESAWGKYKRENSPDTSTDQNARIGALMHMVAHTVSEAAMVGSLAIKGRPPGEIEFEEIPKATWRLAAIVANPDMASIWKLEVIARSGVDPDRIERVLSYDSLIVNFEQFQAVFDSMAPNPE